MRRVFFSFKYEDVFKVNVVRNSGVLKNNSYEAGFIDKAEREKLKKQTVSKIKNWIDKQLEGTSVTVVLVGENTWESNWVLYEIKQSIEKRNGLLCVYIHEIKDQYSNMSQKGKSPFIEQLGWISSKDEMLNYPCCSNYNWISDDGYNNLGDWVEKAAKQAGK